MHALHPSPHPDDLHSSLATLKAQLQQITQTLAVLEQNLPAPPQDNDAPPPATGYTLLGTTYPVRTLSAAFVAIFRQFALWDPAFPVRFKQALAAELAKTKKPSKRGYLASTPQALYPGAPQLWKHAQEIAPGWLLGTNESSAKKLALLTLACQVMGLGWGKELRLALP